MSLESPAALDYVSSATVDLHEVPVNLPVASPTIGYEALAMLTAESDASEELNELENQAHAHKVLLSSDAMRFFVAHVKPEHRTTTLEAVIKNARVSFPSEDGWVVVNLQRMEGLVATAVSHTLTTLPATNTDLENSIPYTPMTAGSLAEAIVLGNLEFAYEMITQRPMLALADAVADLNAIVRLRKGEEASASDVLKLQTERISDETLASTIDALTSALDGTYTNEAEAVKAAIGKAIQVVG